MPNNFTETTFSSTYKDDYAESDGYHRVLFNAGRALQAREVTQLQTIIQSEIARFGRNIFKEGATVRPGGLTVNSQYEFIKLASSTTLPSDPSILVDEVFEGVSGIKVKVLEVVTESGSDPATLYVKYTDTSSGTSGATPIRMIPGEEITNGTYTYTVQSTNTVNNRAVGAGTRASMGNGDFFVAGHFVFAPAQSKIVSKYSSTPTTDIGFIVTQDIVTADDNSALYDNQGETPNITAPGADRYRIRLTLTTRDEVDSDQTFIYVARLVDGAVVDNVDGKDDYNKINDLLALRTKEESGNYNVKQFKIKFEDNDSDASLLNLKVSDGVSYINGYRAAVNYPQTIEVPKAQDTITVNNEVSAASYGNYVVVNGVSGLPNTHQLEQWNLRSSTGYGGSTIGTARVRYVEEDGANLRFYLFDIRMNAGSSFRSARSIGSSASSYADIVLENGQAVIKEAAKNYLFFTLPNARPQSLSDISLTVQRRFSTTTDSSGAGALTLTAPGETFANTNDWIMANEDSDLHLGATVAGAGTASASISAGPPNSSNFEVLAQVNKSAAASRTKTLTETTVTAAVESDGAGTVFVDLGRADIYNALRIRATDSDGADLSTRFTLDNGQRDNYYSIGRMVLRGGATVPSGNVFVRFNYFAHSTSGDFFSVNSYSGQVNYADIPTHRLSNGELLQLRDVLDFRPVINAAGNYASGTARVNELPENGNLVTTDITYYQPKYAKLVIDTNSQLKVISGPSSLTPIFPPVPANSLPLYNIRFNPFTLNDSDMSVEKINTRRYTMADIGRLDARIDRLEELTTLSLLELETANLDVLDSSGVNRTKAGFLVDNFKNHSLSDTTNVEYRASIDPNDRIMRPGFWSENVRMIYDSDLSTNTVLKGDNVYLKYSHAVQIDQPLATSTENVNPFSVITNLGSLTLSPSSDNWAEQRRIAARIIDGGEVISANLQQNWNNWLWNWSGRNITSIEDLSEAGVGTVARTNFTTNTVRGGNVRRITQTLTISEVVGERVVDVALVPFMRSIKVHFKAEGLRPNTRMFPFFDGVRVDDWVREEAFTQHSTDTTQYGNLQNNVTSHPETPSTLVTDDGGKIEGSFFIPNNANLRFRAGSRELTLLDISAFNAEDALSIAREVFEAQGAIQTVQADIVSTRRIRTVTNAIRNIGGNPDDGGYNHTDPLAQSFLVTDTSGIYATKVGIRFATKDSTIPIQMQIRPMVNGHPSSTEFIPGSQKYLSPGSITTSADASVITEFEFDEPVYLAPETEYAIVLLAESKDYNVYVAETEQFIIGSTERKVTTQPTLGSLFRSQNGSTWSPDQTKDMTFIIYRAEFADTTGSVVMENAPIPNYLLDADPFNVDSGSSTIRVFHPNHGMFVNDAVIIGCDSSADIGGIAGTSLQGSRTITAVDWTGYTFTADSSSTSDGFGGGITATASQNYAFDIFMSSFEVMVPNSTSAAFYRKTTSGKSFAGSETPYSKTSTYADVTLFDNNFLNAPALVASPEREISELGGAKSLTVKCDFTTSDAKVSPVIDMQRASMFLINNVVDRQDSDATINYNVPLSFVDETDPTGGTAPAKHITKPVTLEEEAVGLKILVGAHRPNAGELKVYYRTGSADTTIDDTNWTLATQSGTIPSDENRSVFREYEYLVGGIGGNLDGFTQFQIKIVMNSTNSSKVPIVRDLRVIAMSV